MPETPEILTKAADYIGEHGHHKRAFYYRGAVCARGAINAVAEGEADYCGGFAGSTSDQVARALADHLGLEIEDDSPGAVIVAIGDWNDDPERTADDVMGAMRACAAELKAAAS